MVWCKAKQVMCFACAPALASIEDAKYASSPLLPAPLVGVQPIVLADVRGGRYVGRGQVFWHRHRRLFSVRPGSGPAPYLTCPTHGIPSLPKIAPATDASGCSY